MLIEEIKQNQSSTQTFDENIKTAYLDFEKIKKNQVDQLYVTRFHYLISEIGQYALQKGKEVNLIKDDQTLSGMINKGNLPQYTQMEIAWQLLQSIYHAFIQKTNKKLSINDTAHYAQAYNQLELFMGHLTRLLTLINSHELVKKNAAQYIEQLHTHPMSSSNSFSSNNISIIQENNIELFTKQLSQEFKQAKNKAQKEAFFTKHIPEIIALHAEANNLITKKDKITEKELKTIEHFIDYASIVLHFFNVKKDLESYQHEILFELGKLHLSFGETLYFFDKKTNNHDCLTKLKTAYELFSTCHTKGTPDKKATYRVQLENTAFSIISKAILLDNSELIISYSTKIRKQTIKEKDNLSFLTASIFKAAGEAIEIKSKLKSDSKKLLKVNTIIEPFSCFQQNDNEIFLKTINDTLCNIQSNANNNESKQANYFLISLFYFIKEQTNLCKSLFNYIQHSQYHIAEQIKIAKIIKNTYDKLSILIDHDFNFYIENNNDALSFIDLKPNINSIKSLITQFVLVKSKELKKLKNQQNKSDFNTTNELANNEINNEISTREEDNLSKQLMEILHGIAANEDELYQLLKNDAETHKNPIDQSFALARLSDFETIKGKTLHKTLQLENYEPVQGKKRPHLPPEKIEEIKTILNYYQFSISHAENALHKMQNELGIENADLLDEAIMTIQMAIDDTYRALNKLENELFKYLDAMQQLKEHLIASGRYGNGDPTIASDTAQKVALCKKQLDVCQSQLDSCSQLSQLLDSTIRITEFNTLDQLTILHKDSETSIEEEEAILLSKVKSINKAHLTHVENKYPVMSFFNRPIFSQKAMTFEELDEKTNFRQWYQPTTSLANPTNPELRYHLFFQQLRLDLEAPIIQCMIKKCNNAIIKNELQNAYQLFVKIIEKNMAFNLQNVGQIKVLAMNLLNQFIHSLNEEEKSNVQNKILLLDEVNSIFNLQNKLS